MKLWKLNRITYNLNLSKNVRTQDVRTQEFFKQGGSFYTRKVAKVWKGMGKSKKFRKQTPPKIWQTIWVKPLLWCLFPIKWRNSRKMKNGKEWENQKSTENESFLKFDKLFGLSLYCGVYLSYPQSRPSLNINCHSLSHYLS